LETDLPGGQYGMAEEFTEKLKKCGSPRAIEILRRDGDIRPSVPSSHWFRASTTFSFFFYNSVLTEEEVLPHRN
jgi:hypothetical protein